MSDHRDEQHLQRPKVDQKQQEREAHLRLDAATTDAIDQAVKLAALVADQPRSHQRGLPIDVSLGSLSEAAYVRKRVNDALSVGEWLAEVSVLVWRDDEQLDQAMTADGENNGFELRIVPATAVR